MELTLEQYVQLLTHYGLHLEQIVDMYKHMLKKLTPEETIGIIVYVTVKPDFKEEEGYDIAFTIHEQLLKDNCCAYFCISRYLKQNIH